MTDSAYGNSGSSPPILEDFITAKELASLLGISERSLNSQRGLPNILIGAIRVYHKPTVASWLKGREAR